MEAEAELLIVELKTSLGAEGLLAWADQTSLLNLDVRISFHLLPFLD